MRKLLLLIALACSAAAQPSVTDNLVRSRKKVPAQKVMQAAEVGSGGMVVENLEEQSTPTGLLQEQADEAQDAELKPDERATLNNSIDKLEAELAKLKGQLGLDAPEKPWCNRECEARLGRIVSGNWDEADFPVVATCEFACPDLGDYITNGPEAGSPAAVLDTQQHDQDVALAEKPKPDRLAGSSGANVPDQLSLPPDVKLAAKPKPVKVASGPDFGGKLIGARGGNVPDSPHVPEEFANASGAPDEEMKALEEENRMLKKQLEHVHENQHGAKTS